MKKIILYLILLFGIIYLFRLFFINEKKVFYHNKIAYLELPEYSNDDIVVKHRYYTLCYDENNEIPKWVAYVLTRERVNRVLVKRTDDFREDPNIPTKSALPEDYKGSNYDKGHMLPAADMRWDRQAMSETFYMSNIVPQARKMNSGIWNELENKVREWARIYDTLYIVTGPIVIQNNPKRIGKINKVTVPDYLYKTILRKNNGQINALGFIIPNQNKLKSYNIFDYVFSIDSIEKKTGINLYYNLPDDIENLIEARVSFREWTR